MSTAEYCVGTVAAVAFAAVLYEVLKSVAIKALVTGVISKALSLVLFK
jgi:hypothetical protein